MAERSSKSDFNMYKQQSYGLMDISEEEKYFKVYIDAPGMNKEDIDISIEGTRMIVKGTCQTQFKGSVYYSERSQLALNSEILLPPGTDYNKISSTYVNGVIIITIGKIDYDRNKILKKIPVECPVCNKHITYLLSRHNNSAVPRDRRFALC